jgi:glycosyltransferase involved in cell wall biosynthesis
MLRTAFAIPGDLSTPTGGYAYDREVLARLSRHGVAVRHLALPAGFPYPDDDALDQTRTRLGNCVADEVLLIDGLALGALPPSLIEALRSPVVALVHHPLGHESGLDRAIADAFVENERAVLAFARHVVVTSPTTGRLLTTDFAIEASRITVAVPGTAKAARATGSGGRGPLQLLAVGAVSRRKGYDVLIEALAALGSREWQLTIAGDAIRAPDVAADIRTRISTAGFDDRVRMLGSVDTEMLVQLYTRADVFLMPSLYEGYGMVLAEAMARGLPIVCTTGGAAAENVPDGAGIKVPPGDAAAFAAALRSLLDAPALRARLADASWAAGQRLPDWDETTAVIAGVLHHVATEGASR